MLFVITNINKEIKETCEWLFGRVFLKMVQKSEHHFNASLFFDENQVFFKVKKTSRSRLCLQRGLVYQDKCARAHLFYGHYSEDCLEQLAIELLLYNKEVGKARIFNSLQFSAECLLLRLNSRLYWYITVSFFFISFFTSITNIFVSSVFYNELIVRYSTIWAILSVQWILHLCFQLLHLNY